MQQIENQQWIEGQTTDKLFEIAVERISDSAAICLPDSKQIT